MNVPTIFLAATVAARAVAPGIGMDEPAPVKPFEQKEPVEARDAAALFLRHLYAVYLALRGCDEASRQLGKPEYAPSVALGDARRTMKGVDEAANEAGLDIDQIWSAAAPSGVITAESLKSDTPGHLGGCRRIGGVFRVDLGNLQNVLAKLGSRRPLIEKDF